MRSAVIYTVIGVKQGLSTSIILFIIFIDQMAKQIKEAYHTDGFGVFYQF